MQGSLDESINDGEDPHAELPQLYSIILLYHPYFTHYQIRKERSLFAIANLSRLLLQVQHFQLSFRAPTYGAVSSSSSLVVAFRVHLTPKGRFGMSRHPSIVHRQSRERPMPLLNVSY